MLIQFASAGTLTHSMPTRARSLTSISSIVEERFLQTPRDIADLCDRLVSPAQRPAHLAARVERLPGIFFCATPRVCDSASFKSENELCYSSFAASRTQSRVCVYVKLKAVHGELGSTKGQRTIRTRGKTPSLRESKKKPCSFPLRRPPASAEVLGKYQLARRAACE